MAKEKAYEELQARFIESSRLITKKEDAKWLLKQIPKKVKGISMIFSFSKNGYKQKDFWSRCHEHPNPTIIVMKSKGNKIFGGFTKDQWIEQSAAYITGRGSFIFSLDFKEVYQ